MLRIRLCFVEQYLALDLKKTCQWKEVGEVMVFVVNNRLMILQNLFSFQVAYL